MAFDDFTQKYGDELKNKVAKFVADEYSKHYHRESDTWTFTNDELARVLRDVSVVAINVVRKGVEEVLK